MRIQSSGRALPLLVAVIIAPLFFAGSWGIAAIGIWIFIVPVVLAEGWLYYALMESSACQATLGQQALHDILASCPVLRACS